MPVLDAKALDADPEGAALLRSVLDAGLKPRVAQAKKFPKQWEGEERKLVHVAVRGGDNVDEVQGFGLQQLARLQET